MITAYFDESGTHRESAVFVLAGYLATDEDWDRFGMNWKRILDNPTPYPVESLHAHSISTPLDCFHAKEIEGLGEGRFRALGQQNRTYIKTEAINCVVEI